MREILFRGKLLCSGKWVEGDLLQYLTMTIIQCRNETERTVRYEKHLVEMSTVGQFTGLCDRNGKRIFEGDIISCFHENLLVEWDAGAFQSSNYDKLYPLDHFVARNCEVAGNIHDNPNLIAGGGEDGN